MKIYLASGWFSEEQLALCKQLENTLDGLSNDTFKPRVVSDITGTIASTEQRKSTFKGNVEAIDSIDLMVANMTYPDKGVLFEVGYAYAKNKPIIFLKENDGKPFNLMLAQASDFAPACSIDELVERFEDFKNGITSEYSGMIE